LVIDFNENFLSTSKAAKYCGVHPQTLWKWRKQRRGPAYIYREARVFYKIEDLNTFLSK